MLKVLVTGGAGFIGSHLVDQLVLAGHDVTVLDALTTGRIVNLADSMPSVRFRCGSILDRPLVDALVSDADVVFHLAAAVGVRNILASPVDSIIVNTHGTENVLLSCRDHWKRVVIASSSEIYGRTGKIPMREDDDRVLGPPDVHRWSYSTAKALDEHLAFGLATEGVPVSIVRYFNTYGPRMAPHGYGSVVANLFRQAMAGEPMTVHGDGLQTRSFTYVADTARGTAAAGFHDAAVGTAVNLGNAREITILNLAELVRAEVGGSSEIVLTTHESYYGKGFDETLRRVPDIGRARDTLGWEPTIDLAEGLASTYRWLLGNGG
ncbi:MAG: GDP-mannose 4,6-dehydratase [Acidimicrobiales bacterium]